jgi:hypothetical protein
MPIQSQRHRAMLTRVRNAIAHAHLAGTPSRHALWYAERDHVRSGWPNRRLQLTPLRGRKIAAILKTDLGSTVIPI